MSWYYVGPDAKPVGPISVEDLQSRRSSGAIAPETYVIEAPAGSAPKEWRRYRDVFPAVPPAAQPGSSLPPLPPGVDAPTSMGIPHPLFPSAPPSFPSPGGPVFTGVHPSAYRLPGAKNNPWCVWGFGLALASLPCLLCAIGVILAPIAFVLSLVGLVQVNHRPGQQGRGLAIAGLLLSILSIILAVILVATVAASSWHSVVAMTTEQTSNDSDTR